VSRDEGLEDAERLDPDEAVRALPPQEGVVLLVVAFDLQDLRVAEEASDVGGYRALVLFPQDALAVLVELGDEPQPVCFEEIPTLAGSGRRESRIFLDHPYQREEDVLSEPIGDRLAELGEKLVYLCLLGLVEAV